MEDKQNNHNKDEVNFIPLIIFDKDIQITDEGIAYLKSFNNKVIENSNNFI
jgi:hypothetical protein